MAKKNKAQAPKIPAAPTSTPRVDNMTLRECIAMAHPRNPKEHDTESLMASIRRFGFIAPPTIDEASKTMVAGHGRCEALARMKGEGEHPPSGVLASGDDWLVPVLRGVTFRDADERDRYLIADNQHVIAGAWNMEALSSLLRDLSSDDPYESFYGLGFSDVDLQTLDVVVMPDPEPTEPGLEPEGDKTTVKEHERQLQGKTEMSYRLIVTCRDEQHHAEMMERFEEEGLEVQPLIS